MNFTGRDFLRVLDYSEDELRYMLATAKKFKQLKKEGKNHKVFPDKNIAIIFELHCSRHSLLFFARLAKL